MRSVEALLRDYRTAAAAHSASNDGSKRWVQRVNRAADKMRHIAEELSQRDSEARAAFITLLSDEDAEPVKKWAAHHILEMIPCHPDVEQRALGIIEGVAALDSAEAIGERIWLRNWRASKVFGDEFVHALCRLPLDLRNSNQSPVDLLRSAGYGRHGADVRASDIVRCLRRTPDLVEPWLTYSNDKRSGGWYVTEGADGDFQVGCYPSGQVSHFRDLVEAVAEFVVRELRGIGENAG